MYFKEKEMSYLHASMKAEGAQPVTGQKGRGKILDLLRQNGHTNLCQVKHVFEINHAQRSKFNSTPTYALYNFA